MVSYAIVGFIFEGMDYLTLNNRDVYPNNLGTNILSSIQGIESIDKLKTKMVNLIRINNLNEIRDEKTKQHVVNNLKKQGIDKYISGKVRHMVYAGKHLNKGHLCKYGYIFNIDTLSYEVYFKEKGQQGLTKVIEFPIDIKFIKMNYFLNQLFKIKSKGNYL